MSEHVHHHEVVRPLVELARQGLEGVQKLGSGVIHFLADKIVPEDTFNDFIGTFDTEPTQPAVDWTSPDGTVAEVFVPPVPDVAGKDVLPNIQLGDE